LKTWTRCSGLSHWVALRTNIGYLSIAAWRGFLVIGEAL
jgi:hypothetical protein